MAPNQPEARRTRAQKQAALDAGNPVSPLQELVPTRKLAAKGKGRSREKPVVAAAPSSLPPSVICSQSSCDLVVAIPNATVNEFLQLLNTHEWKNAPPVIAPAEMAKINAIVALPPPIYHPILKRARDDMEEDFDLPVVKKSRLRDHRLEQERLARIAREKEALKKEVREELRAEAQANLPMAPVADLPPAVPVADSPPSPIAQEPVVTLSQPVAEVLATPQQSRRWALGGLTQSVGRLFRFGNQPSLDPPVAPASAPHAPTHLAPAESAPTGNPPPANTSIPRVQRPAKAKVPTQPKGGASENSLYVPSNTDSDESGDEQHSEIVRKAVAKQLAKERRELERQQKKLEFEVQQKKLNMDREIDTKVKAQLANKSKKRRHVSPDVIPNPPGCSYGLDPQYFVVSSSDEEDGDLQDTPSKRPTKRQRADPLILAPPTRKPTLVGNPKRARPYTGTMFADHPKENIFDSSTYQRGGLLKSDKDVERKAEMWNSNPVLSEIPEHQRNYAGSFMVPTSPTSSDEDDESTTSTTPTGSPNKSAAPNTGSSAETSSGSWTQPPPRAPVPSPAALPKSILRSPDTRPDPLAKAREQANRFAPSRPSGLRNASRVSMSTIASEGDREDDQAETHDAPATSIDTPNAASSISLLTEPTTVAPHDDDPTCLYSTLAALGPLDPDVIEALKKLRPEDLAKINFPPHTHNADPTSLSAIAALGPLEPVVMTALKYLRPEDLAPVQFPKPSTYVAEGLVEPMVQDALDAYWTDEDATNASTAFAADFATWKAKQRQNEAAAIEA